MIGAEARWNAVRSLLQARRDDPPLEAAPRTADLPASFAQEGLWFLDRLRPRSTAYHLAVACRLEGPLDVGALQRSLAELVRRHDILRTTLRSVDGALVQRVEPARTPRISIDEVDAADVERWAADCADIPFDLERRPAFRAQLARLAPRDHCLLLTMHHSIFDAWSFELFMRELCMTYAALRSGLMSPLGAAGLQYGDYAAWQRRRMTGRRRDELIHYWSDRLRGDLATLRLPADRTRQPGPDRRAGTQSIALSLDLVDALKALSIRQGATLYVVLLAAFKVLLHRHAGDEDVIVGSPFTNRSRPELEDMLGMFTNVLPLRTHLGGRPTLRQLIARVQETVTGGLANQDLPLELIVKAASGKQRSGSPPFSVMFAFQNVPRTGWSWPDLRATAWSVPSRQAQCEIALTMQATSAGARAQMAYDADLFDASTIARLLDQLITLLHELARDPDRPIDEVPLLRAAERHRLLTRWNVTTTPYPRDLAIHRIFEGHARRAPEATALVGDGVRLSYAELDRRANQLARCLVRHELGPHALIAICLERSPAMIVAQLAILKAGAAYLPISPTDRSVSVWRRAAAFVTDAAGAGLVSGLGVPIVRVDDPRLGEQPGAALEGDLPAHALAYVMFTSGSTGAPRGVCVPHRAVVRLVRGSSYARFAADEVFAQLAPAAFDASTFEIWGALLNGATLVIAPARPLSIAELRALIERHRVTTMFLTSGLFERFVDEAVEVPRSLRQLLTGGDVMSVPHAARFLRRGSGCRLINCYGPTENTTFTTTHVIDRVEHDRAIPIGLPIANTRVYVLDRHLEPVPLGAIGEAYASGDGLARGYLADERATGERFVASPFGDGEVLYQTGDLVRQRGDGLLEFVGRSDDQIKIRGFRVEPGEVEQVLREHARVRGVAVVAEARGARGKRLLGFVVPDRAEDDLPARLRGYLRARLPEYLVPAELVIVSELPLTINGKPDRQALLALPRPAPPSSDRPRDALEHTLARLFEEALHADAVSIHDDFFDAGGDSLAVVGLGAAIERELGRSLPLVTLFERPTIAQLAEALRAATTSPIVAGLGPNVVQLKAGGVLEPLFLVPGGRGGRAEVAICAQLVARLGGDQAVLGLLAPLQGRAMSEIARHYVREICRVQPHGPYRLGGQCIGGLIAYEIAQQLRARGETIELLLLIDSWCPTTAGVISNALIGHPLSRLKAGLAFLAALPTRDRDAEPWPRELWRRAVVPEAEKRHMRACLRYRPVEYPGQLTILASDESLRLGVTERWRALAAGGIVVHRAPGDHESYFKRYPRETAECFRICLEQHAQRKVAHELSHRC